MAYFLWIKKALKIANKKRAADRHFLSLSDHLPPLCLPYLRVPLWVIGMDTCAAKAAPSVDRHAASLQSQLLSVVLLPERFRTDVAPSAAADLLTHSRPLTSAVLSHGNVVLKRKLYNA